MHETVLAWTVLIVLAGLVGGVFIGCPEEEWGYVKGVAATFACMACLAFLLGCTLALGWAIGVVWPK